MSLFSWLTVNAGAFVLALFIAALLLAGALIWLALRLRKAEARYRA